MKECDIVQDLLIGYSDGTLREGSKELVEKHIKNCEKCNSIYNEIKNDETDEEIEKNEEVEIDYLKKINKKNSKKNIFITILTVLIVLIILISIPVFINYYNISRGMEIFLNDDISDEQLENIKNIIIEQTNGNVEIRYKSKAEAFEEFKNRLKTDNANVLDDYKGEKNIFPASLIVKLKYPSDIKILEQKLKDMQGIKKFTYSSERNLYMPYVYFFAQFFVK